MKPTMPTNRRVRTGLNGRDTDDVNRWPSRRAIVGLVLLVLVVPTAARLIHGRLW
jgi:hypothetical protein